MKPPKRINNWKHRTTKSTSPIYWYNKKINSHLYLYRIDKEDKEFKWQVLTINGNNKEQKILRKFKLKSPAIEFMENWMNEHPEG